MRVIVVLAFAGVLTSGALAIAGEQPGRPSKLEREALLGDAKAAYELLNKTALAAGGPAESQYWLEIAAENRHPIAQYNLGAKLLGNADPRDQIRAEYWLSRAAKNGDDSAAKLLKQVRKGTLKKAATTKQ